jgi:3-hydroxyacyl-[acyl-carrier-protein] dehydratase
MRWVWLDRIVELEKARRLVAVRTVSWGEDLLHDHFAKEQVRDGRALPCMPHTLVIEGMAQAAGVLAGHANDFREKVILAKIGKATFAPGVLATPGTTLRHTATLEKIDASGAATSGVVELIPAAGSAADAVPFAAVDLMFSHVDQNRQGLAFPEHNFVFTEQFMSLLDVSGIARPADQ